MNECEFKLKKQRPHLRLYLYHHRIKANLTIYRITERLALSKPYYYQIEQGTKGHKMDVVFLSDLASVLGVSFCKLCLEELEYQKERRQKGLRREGRIVLDE